MSMSRSPAAAPFRARDRLTPPDRRRRRTLAGEGGLSLLLHVLVIVVVLLTFTRKHPNDVTDSAAVAVVFEGGPKATTPETQESRNSHPTAPPDIHSTEPATPGAAPPSRPSPQAEPHAQQQPEQQPTPPAAPPPQPAQPSPQAEPGVTPMQLPRASQVPSPPAPPHPVQRQARRATAPASPFAALSAPMSLSLAGRPPPPASQGHLQRGILLSLAPTDQNRNVMTRYATARHKLGEDWWAQFSEFVEEHKYYPMSAASRGEDGQCVLHLVIERDGTVKSVSLELSSGSARLDDAWISEFRGAKVPPFPEGTEESEIDFPASMTYILEHM